jgi:hypothetical protein
MTEGFSEWHFDEILQDNVWDNIFFYLITKDISMKYEWDPCVMQTMQLVLSPPDPKTFIPFDKVDERCVLGWIDRYMSKEMIKAQRKNTRMLQIKLNGGHHDHDVSAREVRDYLR